MHWLGNLHFVRCSLPKLVAVLLAMARDIPNAHCEMNMYTKCGDVMDYLPLRRKKVLPHTAA